ncbi:MAG: redox-sensing transcriptional repressor Rex [Chloroflexi bacterium]|nr:redox-sensing transcriptional repressor Rex [Chloroflexota bacterium]
MPEAPVPEIVVGRLPLYLRALVQMGLEGRQVTSSQELGERLGISSAQIRKDLSQFGEFGKQGTGYNIAFLVDQLKRILKVETVWDVALVGVGDLGRAVAHYAGFIDRGFRIAALFDSDPAKVGTQINNLPIEDTGGMVPAIRQRGLKVAMLAVPARDAQGVADRLVEAGIQAILCYAPTSISVPANVRVQYIDPVVRLQQMTHYL